jgi:murein DD-endopeptidase MepM/ murein hydrolase activator NlpD
LNKTVPVYEAKGRYFALVQINITAKEGDYTLELRRLSDDGAYEKVASAGYTITAAQFTRQDLKTTSGTQSIYTPANLDSDNEKVEKAVSESRPAPYWRGVFLRPAEGEISTGFGQMRYVNYKLQSRHSGIDIAAAENSQVIAAAAGKVVFADELIVNGNTVIIDHGLNVFTSYSHLNTISVKAGDIIKAGDLIGLVGSTGYSTGPHLHYTVMVNGYYINPSFTESEDLLADLVKLAG